MLKSEKINSYIDWRGFIKISSLIAFALALITIFSEIPVEESINYGLFLSSINMWLEAGVLSWSINLLLIIAVAVLVTICNNQFQFIRTFTSLPATIFVILATCNIGISNNLISGNLLAIVVIISVSLLYFTLQNPNPALVFTIFLLLTGCSIFQYAYLTLIPVFIIGVIQMQAISIKTILAMALGVITPFWVLYGLHIVSPSDMQNIQMVSIANVEVVTNSPRFIYNLATAIITFILLVKNMFSVYNYPPHVRAYNGVLTLLTLWALFVSIVDFQNSNSYIPTLYLCCALQVAHSYTISHSRYKYLWVVTLIASYIALYIWQIL